MVTTLRCARTSVAVTLRSFASAVLAAALLAGCAGGLDGLRAARTQCIEPGQPLQATLMTVVRAIAQRGDGYTATPTALAPPLLGLVRPEQIAVSGPDLYIADPGVGLLLRTDRMQSDFVQVARLPATRIGGLAADRMGDVLMAVPAEPAVRLYPRIGGPARRIGESTALSSAVDVAIDGIGNIFVADGLRGNVVRFDRLGQVSGIVGERRDRASPFESVSAVALAGDVLHVLDGVARKIHVLPPGGAGRVLDLGPEARFPVALAIDPWGRIFVADRGRGTLTVLQSGAPQIGDLRGLPTLQGAADVAVDDSGIVYVADAAAGAVYVLDVPKPCP